MTLGSRAPALGFQSGWVIAGALGIGAAQWAMVALMAHRTGAASVGGYALALAITAPCFTLSMLQLRAMVVVADDAEVAQRPYVATRAVTSVTTALVLGLVSVFVPGAARAFILPLALCRGIEGMGDIHLAGLQRSGLTFRMGQCQALAAGVSTLTFGAVLWLVDDAVLAVWALVPAALVCSLLLPWLIARSTAVSVRLTGRASASGVRGLIAEGLPLGLSSTVSSLTAGAPRWALNASGGPASVGAFVGAAQLVQAVSTFVGAATQTWFPREAARYRAHGYQTIRRTRRLAVVAVVVVGVVLVPLSVVAGPAFLSLIYGNEFHVGPMGCAMFALAGSTVVGNWFLEYALVIVGRRRFVFGANTGALVVVAVAALVLVPHYEVGGAAAAAALGAAFQVGAKLVGLRQRAVGPGHRPGRHRAVRTRSRRQPDRVRIA